MILNLKKFNLLILNSWIAVVISSSMFLFNVDQQKLLTCQKKCLGGNKTKMMKHPTRTKQKTRKKSTNKTFYMNQARILAPHNHTLDFTRITVNSDTHNSPHHVCKANTTRIFKEKKLSSNAWQSRLI